MRIGIGIIAVLLAGTIPSGVVAKNRPAGQSGISACMSDPGATNKYRGSASSPFASCCYDDGCWSCTDALKPGEDAVCAWLPAPLAFPQRKFQQFNPADTLDPGAGATGGPKGGATTGGFGTRLQKGGTAGPSP